ncbi:MAG: polysaccharide biosynthesis tyrosine autokinase [Actinomycetota bacterium]|nr:polysaccharide biosynthesis tyrosine autokinase [Actinomycetota bacterium]
MLGRLDARLRAAVVMVDQRGNLRSVLARKWLVIFTTLVCGASVFFVSSSRPKIYSADAEVWVGSGISESLVLEARGGREDPKRNIATQVRIIESRSVRRAVEEILGSVPRPRAEPVPDTDIIEVSVRHEDRQRSAAIADAYVDAYLAFLRSEEVRDLGQVRDQLRQSVDSYQGQLAQLDADLRDLSSEARRALAQEQAPQRSAILDQQSSARQLLDRFTAAEARAPTGARRVSRAAVSSTPVSPQPVRDLTLGAAFGLLLGIGFAFLAEAAHASVKGSEDISAAGIDCPIVGHVPPLPRRGPPSLIMVKRPTSPGAEAFRTLRAQLEFGPLNGHGKLVQVTSPAAEDGKTTVAVNLALALAQQGRQRTLLVESNLRDPCLADLLKLRPNVGLTSVLDGSTPLAQAIQHADKSLFVLLSGPPTNDPGELIASSKVLSLIEALRRQVDAVILDSPPILPVSDAVVLSRQVDMTLLVASVGHTSRFELHRSIQILHQVGSNIGGIVLNRSPLPPA